MRLLPQIAVTLYLGLNSTATIAAQSATDRPDRLSASIEIVSDYRFRGISLSNNKPAIQGDLRYSHPTGFFLGSWSSNITGDLGTDIELDLYVGYSNSAAGVFYTVAAYKYIYPGTSGLTYVEFQGKIETPIGPSNGWLELALTPNQKNADHNIYTAAGLSYEGPHHITFIVKSGREDGAYESKWDYELGFTRSIGRVALRAIYTGTNRRAARLGNEAKSGFLLGAGVRF